MKRILFIISFSIVYFINSFAQQNENVSSTSHDSISVNNLHGIYMGGGLSLAGSGSKTFLSLGYLNEFNIKKNISVTLGGNIINSIYQKRSNIPLSTSVNAYGIQLSVSAEMRAYLNWKNNNFNRMNSGCFIGLPLEVFSSYLNTKEQRSDGVMIAPSVGYRYALSNKIFMEAAAGLGLSLRTFQVFDALPYIRLKACYRF